MTKLIILHKIDVRNRTSSTPENLSNFLELNICLDFYKDQLVFHYLVVGPPHTIRSDRMWRIKKLPQRVLLFSSIRRQYGLALAPLSMRYAFLSFVFSWTILWYCYLVSPSHELPFYINLNVDQLKSLEWTSRPFMFSADGIISIWAKMWNQTELRIAIYVHAKVFL